MSIRSWCAVSVGAMTVAWAGACGDTPTGSLSAVPVATDLEFASEPDRSMFAGRGAEPALRVRALGPTGEPAAGVEVTFELEGSAGGALSQPVARTNRLGTAETQLIETTPGSGRVVARSGSATLAFTISVQRAPGRIEFESDSSGVGLPGLAHPDSVIAVRVLDTEGNPLEDTPVWFASGGSVSRFSDTTDVDGRASTVLRSTRLSSGQERVTAFIIGFPEVTRSIGLELAQPAERVLIVSVEGLRADAIDRWQPPVLTSLVEGGASWVDARTIQPSLTVPAHLSLWSGQGPDAHGVANDTLRFTPEMAGLDPLFRNAGRSGRESAAFLSAEGPLAGFGDLLRCRLAFGFDSLAFGPANAAALEALARPTLKQQSTDVVFVHLPDPDIAGHTFGFTSSEYGEAVVEVDRALGGLIGSVDLTKTLVIVTAPHGGGGMFGDFLHGSGADEDVLIPLLLAGPGVVPGPRTGASILDVAPTALWALGMAPPAEYEGRVLLEAFRRP